MTHKEHAPPCRGYPEPVTAVPLGLSDRHGRLGLVDQYGRRARDLRVSLTDRCNLRCTYCMPAEGLDWMPTDDLLTEDELGRLIGIAVRDLGITRSGSPGENRCCARASCSWSSGSAGLRPRPEMSLTTNGIGLARRADEFAAAGLDRINVSLDTLDRQTFLALTRRDRLRDVIDALAAAAAVGLAPVKINTLLLRDVNDHEAPTCCGSRSGTGTSCGSSSRCRSTPGHTWSRARMVTADEILERLSAEFDLTPHPGARDGAPAELFDVDGGPGTVGIIASVTRPFCGDCDRTRLTADGQIRTCLFSRSETDLRGMLRGGARTKSWPMPGASRCGASCRATESTIRRSCSPTGR